MLYSSNIRISLLATVGLLATACSDGRSVSNASPRIDNVPLQATAGGTMFTLDLKDYVADRETVDAGLVYAVTSGGGSFAGSIYSNMFDTMGEFDVAFTVTDGPKIEAGSFRVRVTSANFATVREDSNGLLLLDTKTSKLLRVSGSTTTPSLATGLGDGRAVYQIASGNGQQLWVFDPLTRANTRIAADKTGNVTYRAKTSDNKLVYTTGTGNTQELFFFNPVTGVSRSIAQGLLSTLTVLVNSDDLVFYEVGNNGQADIYAYDPSEDEVFAVGTSTTDEQLQSVLPNNGVVFTRVGGTGEKDLFYYKVGTGLVEIAATFGNVGDADKTFNAFATASQVVFSGSSGSATEIYVWNPTSGQTFNISTLNGAGAVNTFSGIASGDEVVYRRYNGGNDYDAYLFDVDSLTAASVRNSTDDSQVLAVTRDSGGGVAWAIVLASGATSDLLAISLIGSPATQTWSAGGAVATSVNVLANGDVVALRADGAALNVFDTSAGTWGTAITGTGLTFGGAGLAAGDFVYGLTVTAQTDLSMWDASEIGVVVVSNAAGDDAYQSLTLDSKILFTRVTAPDTNKDLWSWDGTTATRITDADTDTLRHDYSVLGTFAGSR